MERLTHERMNGIKKGYWSPAKKQELVDRLAEYENTGMEPDEIRDIPKWIPVEDGLPEDESIMLVTCQNKTGNKSVNRAYYDGFWHGTGSMAGVVAWMPLPEPYTREGRTYGK